LQLIGRATYSDGKRAEKDIDLRFVVLDRNDCPPVFSMQQIGEVDEHSAVGVWFTLYFPVLQTPH